MTDSARRIESPANPKVKTWRSLHKRRSRDDAGLCLVEGAREVGRALESGLRIHAVLTADDISPSGAELAVAVQRNGADLFELSIAALSKVSQRRHPAEVIAVAAVPGKRLAEIRTETPALVVIADAIEKPGNLGAMIRSADGAGADALIASDPVTDLGNPNIIRSSQGAVFDFQVATGSGAETEAWLAGNGVTPVVATDEASTMLWDVDLTAPTAIVIGSEDKGVSSLWRHHQAISIPMHGVSDSLNASVAAAVILYEARRQRIGNR